ncbi:MAG: hypothetical protein MZV70_67735 [Desulfobacterales bacterium]|nr:hypothetical protein [Desulfobacterales bacterium]
MPERSADRGLDLARMKARMQSPSDDDVRRGPGSSWPRVSEGTIDDPAAAGCRRLNGGRRCRPRFRGELAVPRVSRARSTAPGALTSYSALVSGRRDADAAGPRRRLSAAAGSRPAERSTRGRRRASSISRPAARAGSFFHADARNARLPPAWQQPGRTSIAELLRSSGSTRAGRSAVCAHDRRCRPVPTVRRTSPGAPGRGAPRPAASAEMEFYYPLNLVTPARPARRCSRATDAPTRCRACPNGWGASSVCVRADAGFMKGFIDLVFVHRGRYYLVDWKSNRLGPGRKTITPSRLARRDARRISTTLQYHIYTLALHQYLRRRLPGYDYARRFRRGAPTSSCAASTATRARIRRLPRPAATPSWFTRWAAR